MTAGAAVPATLSGLCQPMAIAMVNAWGLQPRISVGRGDRSIEFGDSSGLRADVLIDDGSSGKAIEG